MLSPDIILGLLIQSQIMQPSILPIIQSSELPKEIYHRRPITHSLVLSKATLQGKNQQVLPFLALQDSWIISACTLGKSGHNFPSSYINIIA
jgi:hypothetical protein